MRVCVCMCVRVVYACDCVCVCVCVRVCVCVSCREGGGYMCVVGGVLGVYGGWVW